MNQNDLKYERQDTKYALIYAMFSTIGAFIVAISYGILTHTI